MCTPHPELPSHLPPTPSLWVILEHWLWVPCFMHRTCTGHLFYIWIYMFQCYSLIMSHPRSGRASLKWASLLAQTVKNMPPSAGELGLIPRSGRSPGVGNVNSTQYSCLEKSMDRGAWWATSVGSQRARYDWTTKHNTAQHSKQLTLSLSSNLGYRLSAFESMLCIISILILHLEDKPHCYSSEHRTAVSQWPPDFLSEQQEKSRGNQRGT